MLHKIDFATLSETVSLPNDVTISNVGGYNYKKIPGLEITMPTKIGSKYLFVSNISIKPTATNEVYVQNRVNGENLGSKLDSNAVGGGWTSLTNLQTYSATGTSTTFSVYSGAAGNSSTGVDILRQSSAVVIQIG